MPYWTAESLQGPDVAQKNVSLLILIDRLSSTLVNKQKSSVRMSV
jgi:hypothetical protein